MFHDNIYQQNVSDTEMSQDIPFCIRLSKFQKQKRRFATKLAKHRLTKTAGYAGHPGPYIEKRSNRVIVSGRGSASRYWKKLSNRILRKIAIDESQSGGWYKKVFDYWHRLV